ncbi:hypothetical protein [Limnothrix redekei]|uniref:Uncharacterized protein n=1 Tax=Limnothrix redekei LRLZ20PSL1 TaxID=3112953 RepID=A0ABW7CAX5_9CYAN
MNNDWHWRANQHDRPEKFSPRDRAIGGGLFGSGLGLGTLTAVLSFPIARSRPWLKGGSGWGAFKLSG